MVGEWSELMETPLAPHPQTPSPREFGLRLMKLAKRVRPNSRGEGAFWLVFLFAKKSRLIGIGLQAESVARLRDAVW